MQAGPTDRVLANALVRKTNKIHNILYYYTPTGLVRVVNGGADIPLLQAIIGSQHTTTAFKWKFLCNDPELLKVRGHWTCALCKVPVYEFRFPIQHHTFRDWLKHKVKCTLIQDKLLDELAKPSAASPTATGERDSRPTCFAEDSDGDIRQIIDTGGAKSSETANVRARRAALEHSALAGAVEPHRVFCLRCDKWVHLAKGMYPTNNWSQHLRAHARWKRRQGSDNEEDSDQRHSPPATRMVTRTQTASRRAGKDALGKIHEGRITRSSKGTRRSSNVIQTSEAGPSRPARTLSVRRIFSSPLSTAPSSTNEHRSERSSPAVPAGNPREDTLEAAAHEAGEAEARVRAAQLEDEEAGDHAVQNGGQNDMVLDAQNAGVEVAARGNASQRVELDVPQGVTRMDISYHFGLP